MTEGNPLSRLEDADRQAAEALAQAIHKAGDGHYTSSVFDRLFGVAHVAHATSEASHFPYRHLVEAREHFQHLITLVYKIGWLADRRAADELDELTWTYFCASDILTFHTVIRSLLDEVSAMASRLGAQRGVPDKGFHKLRKWVINGAKSDEVLGKALAESVKGCDWFDDLRDIRDDLVHRSARAIVLLEPNRVLFQVHLGTSPKIFIPPVMFNANVVDFTTYAALLMARLATFLDRFAAAVFVAAQYLSEEKDESIQSFHMGLVVLKTWLDDLLAETD